jgi:hypothetical protein
MRRAETYAGAKEKKSLHEEEEWRHRSQIQFARVCVCIDTERKEYLNQ